jgi:hypothetical protein
LVEFINQNPDGIPQHLEKILIKGQNGIHNYQKIMKNIEKVLIRNQMMLTKIIKCQDKLNRAKELVGK